MRKRLLVTFMAAIALAFAFPATASADGPAFTFHPVQTTGEEPAAEEAEAADVAEDQEEAAEAEAEPEVSESDPATLGDVYDAEFVAHNLWIMIAAMLVFIMHLGFATLESGLTQAKNTTNILFKNTMIISIGLVTYAICGFNLMYPGEFNIIGGLLGFPGPGISTWTEAADHVGRDYGWADGYKYTYWTDFLFQGMFAATAATIVSGCVAERIKLLPFLVFSALYVGIVYPILGSWHWGGGWAADAGFYDFAGSTLVHSVGGWGGLAAILLLGPRKGKYVDGEIRPILPSNLPLATIGVFLLWFGWFGFNGGSVLAADPGLVSYVLVTTSIAAALGGIAGGVTSWIFGKKPDLTMALNGVLAGLVGITAAPDVALLQAVIVGLLCGVVVYFSVLFFDKIKIDDPVGALSVHLVCGIIGTLFAAANADGGILAQIYGILGYGAAAFILALVIGLIVKALFGWRVSEEEELEGLDVGEHGVTAYHAIEAR